MDSDHVNKTFGPGKVMTGRIRVAWVDSCQLTRECMTAALSHGASPIMALPFDGIMSLIAKSNVLEIDLVVLHAHSMGEQLPQDIAALRAAAFTQPIILVTGDEASDQMANVKNSLRLGASGHLSTQTTGIDLAISSFAFAHQGGTFAPMNLLLADGQAAQRNVSRAAALSRGRRILGPSLSTLPLSVERDLANASGKMRRPLENDPVKRPALRLASGSPETEDKP